MGAVEMLKMHSMFQVGPQRGNQKGLSGGTFKKASRRTDEILSHSGKHSQRYVINASC